MLNQRTWTNENNETNNKHKKQAHRTRYQQQDNNNIKEIFRNKTNTKGQEQ